MEQLRLQKKTMSAKAGSADTNIETVRKRQYYARKETAKSLEQIGGIHENSGTEFSH